MDISSSLFVYILTLTQGYSFFFILLILEREERGRERERETDRQTDIDVREKCRLAVSSTHPDRELKLHLLVYGKMLQPTEPSELG